VTATVAEVLIESVQIIVNSGNGTDPIVVVWYAPDDGVTNTAKGCARMGVAAVDPMASATDSVVLNRRTTDPSIMLLSGK
jgi:hypothetical protein